MFDCAWSDPSHETVGQRRERKARQEGERSRRSSLMSSDSGGSLSATQSPTGFAAHSKNARSGFTSVRFPSLKLRTSSAASNPPRRDIEFAPTTYAPTTSPRMSMRQTRIEDFAGSQRDQHDAVSVAQAPSVMTSSTSSHVSDDTKHLSRATSTSTWTTSCESICRTREVQSLSANSFITRSTEISVCPVDEISHLPSTEVHISVEVPVIKEEEGFASDAEGSPICLTFPQPPASAPRIPEWSDFPKLEPIEGGAWRPPEEWEIANALKSPKTLGGFNGLPGLIVDNDARSEFPDFLTLPIRPPPNQPLPSTPSTTSQRHSEILKLANESIPSLTTSLKYGELRASSSSMLEAEEFEMRLKALTALKIIRAASEPGRKRRRPLISPTGKIKILSLYETDASANFLSAHTPESQVKSTEIHHMRLSTTPASSITGVFSSSLPQIYPLSDPLPHIPLPYASSLFSQLHSQPLYCLLPSSALPTLLKECFRVLLPGGIIFLTILDPRPKVETMGPKLHAWLERNLIMNLERQFRCTTPSRLVPEFAADAGFQTQPPLNESPPLSSTGINSPALSEYGGGSPRKPMSISEAVETIRREELARKEQPDTLYAVSAASKPTQPLPPPSWNYFPDTSSEYGPDGARSSRTPSISSSVKSKGRAKPRSRKARPVQTRIELPAILDPRLTDALLLAPEGTGNSFSAISTPASSFQGANDLVNGASTEERDKVDTQSPASAAALSELKVHVLRQIWLQQWGPFSGSASRTRTSTTGKKAATPGEAGLNVSGAGKNVTSWWWEDEEILRECRERGTTWELLLMEAVKPL